MNAFDIASVVVGLLAIVAGCTLAYWAFGCWLDRDF